VIDNRPGAGGTVGTKGGGEKAIPDGYTLVLGYTGTLAIGPSLYRNAGLRSAQGLCADRPDRQTRRRTRWLVHPSFPAKKPFAELIAYAKANPGKVNFGSAGAGTVSHITGEYFARLRRPSQLVHYSLQGHRPGADRPCWGGHIPMAFAPIPGVASQLSRPDGCARARGDQHDPLQPAA